ncbi:MAG: GyrI-like domain-containing protein [candidate division FCPU426 bacterium]
MPDIKQVESGKLLCLEMRGSLRELPACFAQLEEYVRARRVPVKGDRLAIIYDNVPGFDRERAHFAAAVELAGECTGDGEVTVVVQSVMLAASEFHAGPWDGLEAAYQRLTAWIPEHGYRIAGPAREYYLAGSPSDESSWQTEILIPVERMQGSGSSGT